MAEKIRLKYLCSSFSTPITQDAIKSSGKYPVFGASGLVGYKDEFACAKPYLGIIKDGAGVGRITLYEGESSLLGTMAYILPNEKADIAWLKYALMGLDLANDITSTTIPHIYFKDYSNRLVLNLPIETQRRIAAFLDAKCALIDTVVEQTRASIEEYKKLKQSMITEAVTKGIRPGRKMKASGIEWVPEIPEDWSVIPSKYLFKNTDVRKQDGDVQMTASQQYGIISQAQYMELTGSKVVFANKGLEDWKHVDPFDFIISLRSFQGGLEMSETSGCITWHYIVLKPCKPIYSYYFKWLFKSELYIKALQRTCNFIRDGQDLRYSNFIQVPLFEPCLEEQKEIADYLNEKCRVIDQLIDQKTSLITELAAYKKSLIYEYVTGKKEVPAAE